MYEREFAQHTRRMLDIGQKIVKDKPNLTAETGATNSKGDQTIAMDLALERSFLRYIEDNNLPVLIYSEEHDGIIQYHPNPEFFLAVDPLDGSHNLRDGNGVVPYGSFITIYNGLAPQLKDVAVAGVIEYTRGLTFIYSDKQTKDKFYNNVKLDEWEIHPKTPVYLELYKEGAKYYSPLGMHVFIKNEGALSSHLAFVLHNSAAAMGGIGIKSEEVGAIHALTIGAGGVVYDSHGNDIKDLPLDHSRKYDVLAGSESVVDFMIEKPKAE